MIKITIIFCVYLYLNELLSKELKFHNGRDCVTFLISCSVPAVEQCSAHSSHQRSVDGVCREYMNRWVDLGLLEWLELVI